MQQIEIKDNKQVTFYLKEINKIIIQSSLQYLVSRINAEITESKEFNNADTSKEEIERDRILNLKKRIEETNDLINLSKKDLYDLKNGLSIYCDTDIENELRLKIVNDYLAKLDPLIDILS